MRPHLDDVPVPRGRWVPVTPGSRLTAGALFASGRVAPRWMAPGWMAPGWMAPGWMAPGWMAPGWMAPGWMAPTEAPADGPAAPPAAPREGPDAPPSPAHDLRHDGPSGPVQFDGFIVSQQVLSGAFAKKIGLAVGELAMDARSAVIDYVAMLTTEQEDVIDRGDDAVVATRWGAGVQLQVSITSRATEFTVNLLSAAVAADAQIAEARFELRAIGITDQRFLEELTGSRSGVGRGTFDLESFEQVTRAIHRAKAHMAEDPHLVPTLYNVYLPGDQLAQVADEAASVTFAMRRVAGRDPVEVALNAAHKAFNAGDPIDPGVVEAVYRRLAPGSFAFHRTLGRAKPTADEARRAAEWLDL